MGVLRHHLSLMLHVAQLISFKGQGTSTGRPPDSPEPNRGLSIPDFNVLCFELFYWIHICFGMTANSHQSLSLSNHDSVALSLPRFGYKYLLYLCRVLICSLVYLSTFSLIVSFTTLS